MLFKYEEVGLLTWLRNCKVGNDIYVMIPRTSRIEVATSLISDYTVLLSITKQTQTWRLGEE